MALVDYSDSESDTDAPQPQRPLPPNLSKPSKPAFQKSEPGKIRVDLPALQSEPANDLEGPATKKVRTGGAFSGFNSLLPAPKRTTTSKPKPGVSLKTSSEAAFSRVPPAIASESTDTPSDSGVDAQDSIMDKPVPRSEPKLVGKATRFMPLSVSQKRKKPLKKATSELTELDAHSNGKDLVAKDKDSAVTAVAEVLEKKPRRSLFAMGTDRDTTENTLNQGEYVPMMSVSEDNTIAENMAETAPTQSTAAAAPNSLEAVASDLNLTPGQRRQLFGRRGKDVSVAHFNLDSEYAANEQLRQAGETVEHRAVKAIAPGKHSLQQLVNNAKSQQDAMEDAWAQGRRNRGEGGSKYGWTAG